ncbi:uncharacterized protein [Miscanthus floridulus]|uniref:uncharacterized protein n=1 Tax=Miscanthus floridulus TaxID=154761 RepID=UPI00345B33E7
MALNERLNKFKQQQERCQNILSSIFPSQASISTPKLVPGIQPVSAPLAPVKPLHPIKFSNDTERLQHINSVRKSAVGVQIKLVIELLYKTRQSFTAKQVNEATYVDIHGNKAVFDSLRNNPKVLFDGTRFSYKPKHVLTGRDELLGLIKKHEFGLPVEDIKDAYPSVLEDLQALKASGDVWWLSSANSQGDMAYFNDPKYKITVDNDLKELFQKTELPRDMLDIEKELKKSGEKPMTNTTKRRALAQILDAAPKTKPKGSKKKQRRLTGKSKGITNIHMPELFDA